MSADLKHLHHLLQKSGLTTGEAVIVIHCGAFICGLIGVAGWWLEISEQWMFTSFAVVLSTYVVVTNLMWRAIDAAETAPGTYISRALRRHADAISARRRLGADNAIEND